MTRRRRWGCLALGAIGALLAGFVGYAVLLTLSTRECNPPRTIEGETSEASVLDAASPGIEQRITIHVPAAAVPDATRAATVALHLDRSLTAAVPAASSPSPAAASSDVSIAFIDEATGEFVHRTAPASARLGSARRSTIATIPLRCAVGQDCDRTFRLVVTRSGQTPASGALTWTLRAAVDWGFTDCAGPPFTARPTVTADAPAPLAADRLMTGELPLRQDGATILARHVTVSTASAPAAAYGRLFVRRSDSPWLPWLRIVADEGPAPVVDEPLGGLDGASGSRVVDFPILTGCNPGAPCRSGFWVVVQAIPDTRRGSSVAWEPAPGVGSVDWQVSAVGLRAPGAAGEGSVELRVDDEAQDVGPRPALATEPLRIELDPAVDRVMEVAIHVPEWPAAAPDPRRTAFVVANVIGFGVNHGYHLEGSGAGPIRGGGSGGSSGNLVAHPFDDCPPAGPCDATVRMVGILIPDPHSSMSGTPNVTWQLHLLGVPPGTTATIGPVTDRRRESEPTDGTVPAPVLVLAIAATCLAGLWLVRDARRRSDRAAGSR